MKHLILPVFILLQIVCYGGNQPGGKTYLGIPVSEIENAVKSHLSDWFPRVVDTINGGYYTNFEYDWSRSNDQQKMLVTQSRDMWTASKAATLFPDSCMYRQYAEHGFYCLVNHFWDNKNGGFYLYYSPENPDRHVPYKLIYGNAFALYALAEYAKINPSDEVISCVNKTFRWIDSVAHDNVHGGYHNLILGEKLETNTPENKKYIKRQGWGNPDWKGQNTSIHLLEAFTAVYRVMPAPLVKERLLEMLTLVRDTMVQPDNSLKLYFTDEWLPINNSGKSKSYILKNIYADHISFGHNIETAYLIIDASEALFGKADSLTLKTARRLTEHTLKYGFDKHYYGMFDKGYCFNGRIKIIDRRKTWWSQFEALHTLALMSQYFPDEVLYPEVFRIMWDYIKQELLDTQNGGYFNNGLDTGPGEKKGRKAHNWKGPYHDGRALMQIWSYAIYP